MYMKSPSTSAKLRLTWIAACWMAWMRRVHWASPTTMAFSMYDGRWSRVKLYWLSDPLGNLFDV